MKHRRLLTGWLMLCLLLTACGGGSGEQPSASPPA